MIGVDYASVDGNIKPDWRAARKAGVNFAILRASFSLYSQSRKQRLIMPDPTFQRDWKTVPVTKGAYMFPEPRSLVSPEDQVAVFASAVEEAGGLTPNDFPPVLDIEFPGGLTKGKTPAQKKVVRKQMLNWMVTAAEALKETYGIWPMLYTSARVWDTDHDDALDADTMLDIASVLSDCPLWLARYPYKLRTKAVLTPPEGHPPVPKMWGDGNYWIWQFQGDATKTPGFSSTVDLNKFNYMKIGEKGNRVKWVQKKIGQKVDGIFGPGTHKALCDFQKKNGLGVDGIVGPGTFATLAWA
jgi:GH25 family lysozyme M1 (1,4-beta-N-acetylmuramidase)